MSTASIFMEHYNFRAAFRMFAKRYCAMHSENFFLSKFATEKVRHLMGIYFLRSHLAHRNSREESGPTLAGALSFAERAGIAGRARIATLVRLLQLGGYLRKVTNADDRRYTHYEVTPKAIEKAKGVYRNLLIPISLLTDNPTSLSDLYKNDILLESIVDYAYRCILEFKYISIFVPEIEKILEISGGYEVMLFITLEFNYNQPHALRKGAFNYGRASRELNIPRIQIHRIIRKLQESNLIYTYSSVIELSDRYTNKIHLFAALHMAAVWNGIIFKNI
ncbi:hypothetical protein FZC33_01505 [Labrys sp. KNU-23]|uniref:hypothetical protein n=1 Tax=Labrys sp. KNU-23 TaxID=2789216 RepID=UPI0011EEA0F8|nr:hypothetical protein [Labrys sp. KNU-23]QEN84975.1 hypothetical protein FZC33_01505 [Labrys sp. KNU-23]